MRAPRHCHRSFLRKVNTAHSDAGSLAARTRSKLRDDADDPFPSLERFRTTASRAGAPALRRSERIMLKRAVLVAVLVGSFLGSAVLLSKDNAPPVSVARQGWTDPLTTGSVRPARGQPLITFSGGAEDATEDLP
jgi:hypothetical protein